MNLAAAVLLSLAPFSAQATPAGFDFFLFVALPAVYRLLSMMREGLRDVVMHKFAEPRKGCPYTQYM